MRLESLIKAEICNGNPKPGHEPSDCGHARKPIEDLSSTSRDRHKGKGGEQGAEDDRDVRQAGFGSFEEERRRIFGSSQTICKYV